MRTQTPKLWLLAFLFLSGISYSNAQDIIIKKTKEEIKAKVSEIGLDEIKYKPNDNPDGPVISIAKEDVWKVKFSNGSEWLNVPDPYSVSSATEVRDKNRVFKFEFFSPVFGKLAFGYEQMIKVGMNAEVKLGIIGAGIQNEYTRDNPRGIFVKAGPKFLLGSEYIIRGMRYTHQLAGKYFKPELIFSSYGKDYGLYNYSYPFTYQTSRFHVSNIAINLVYGKQSILGNVMTIDWYVGIGYGSQSTTKSVPVSQYGYYNVDLSSYESYCYSHVYGGPNSPLVYTAGITIGILSR